MMRCKAITKRTGNQCKKAATFNERCHIHQPLQSERDAMYKKELSKLHERVRSYIAKTSDLQHELKDLAARYEEAMSKLKIIDSFDKLKHQILTLDKSDETCARIIKNPKHKKRLEEIFDCSFKQIKYKYFSMLTERNAICHPYTMAHILNRK